LADENYGLRVAANTAVLFQQVHEEKIQEKVPWLLPPLPELLDSTGALHKRG
jgi:hypothetical protein